MLIHQTYLLKMDILQGIFMLWPRVACHVVLQYLHCCDNFTLIFPIILSLILYYYLLMDSFEPS